MFTGGVEGGEFVADAFAVTQAGELDESVGHSGGHGHLQRLQTEATVQRTIDDRIVDDRTKVDFAVDVRETGAATSTGLHFFASFPLFARHADSQ